MVHGLETLKTLNGTAGQKANGKALKVPQQIGNSPGAIRAWANRPWTREELAWEGDRNEAKQADKGNGKPQACTIPLCWAPPGCSFKERTGQTEGLRT